MILRALERGNLFTVGDELQSIYAFRDADVSLFRARRAELAARGATVELARNFRSAASLLAVINAVFAARLADSYTPLVAGGEQPLRDASEGSRAPAVELLLTNKRGWNGNGDLDRERAGAAAGAGAAPWRQAEASALAERVAEIVTGREARAGEVVVLLRALGDIETYERALQDRGLQTLATAGRFWGRQQVGDLLTYLRALANPLDELALYGTLACPLAVMINQTAAPLATDFRIRAVGNQARIFDRNHRLIVIPVQRPGLNLPFGALSGVKEFVERVQAMIARRANLAQPGFELIRRQKLQMTISIPSAAISNPAASTSRRSGEPSIRIGLVLLMWVNIRRAVKPPRRRTL